MVGFHLFPKPNEKNGKRKEENHLLLVRESTGLADLTIRVG